MVQDDSRLVFPENECEDARLEVETHLPKCAQLNSEKTKTCIDANKGIDFLGFRIRTSTLSVRGRNIGKMKSRIASVISTQKVHATWEKTLTSLVARLRFKIQGPTEDQLQSLADLGFRVARYHRSWIGFFRPIDDVQQIRQVDHWIRKQISSFIWREHRQKVNLATLKQFGMPTLLNTLYKARRSKAMKATSGKTLQRETQQCMVR